MRRLEARVLISGLGVGESPRWHDGRLWFADWSKGQIVRLTDAGELEVVAHAAAPPLSFDFALDGRMLVTAQGVQGLLAQGGDGTLSTFADTSGLQPYGWNEIVVDGRGNAYLNTAGFDMMAGEAPKAGSVGLVRPDGSAQIVGGDVMFPNGMAVTPDRATLIVAESYGRKLSCFDIDADGGLSRHRTWADLGDGAPDGICLDAEGAVWYADVPNRCCRRVREGGEVLAEVKLDRGGFACMLGGPDRSTLYIVATEWLGPARWGEMAGRGLLLAAEAPAPGVGWP